MRKRYVLDFPQSLNDQAAEVADAQGIAVAELVRRAVRRYVVAFNQERGPAPKKRAAAPRARA